MPSSPLAQAMANRYGPMMAQTLKAPLSPEEEYLQSMSPVDAHKFATEAQNAKVYTPEQAKANLSQTLMDAAYVTPVLGNVLSAKDAYGYGKQTLNATDDTERRKGALMTELSALGAITGLPFGNAASRAARGAASRTNIFAGPMAKTADHEALANAQRLEQAGASRDEIWAQTGWFKGPDQKWRFEIDDSGSRIVDPFRDARTTDAHIAASIDAKGRSGIPQSASNEDVFTHPELEAAYSDIPSGGYLFDNMGTTRGRYDPQNDLITLDSGASALEPVKQRSTALHENQHGVQKREGFASGASPFGLFASETMDNPAIAAAKAKMATLKHGSPEFEAARKEMMDLEMQEAIDQYRRTAGEVEARNVQSRMNMSPQERRATAPWLTQDVPDEHQIVRFR